MVSDDGNRHTVIRLEIPLSAAKDRLDRFIARNPDLKLTRSRVQKLISEGLVTVDGNAATHNHRLKGGELVLIEVPPLPRSDIVPEKIALDIVYEDAFLLAVNKPAGMVTHPGAGNRQGTLANALLYYADSLSGVGGMDRPGIVHRLDKGTSGLILAAKNDDILLALQEQMKARKIRKTYTALICGHMKGEQGLIDLPVGRSRKDRKKMTVTSAGGRQALTDYRLVDRFKLHDLVEINLRTGRTHQIRVHFSHIGHPLFGDPDYGGRMKWHRGIFSVDKRLAIRALELIDRQALHAGKLEFIHPVSMQSISIEAPLPEDFRNLLDFMRREGR
jgi:23S rRNA pseudouridine1911/1915/1917 synthase